VETHEFKIVPADFFTGNPALDVPSNKNLSSKLVQNGAKGMNGVGETNEANGVHKTNGVNGCCKES
jgi:primary-amine oxidase